MAVGVEREQWSGRRVLVTGHTGFKGAWLALWLASLGAEVTGVATGVPGEPSLYALAGVREALRSEVRADVRDFDAVRGAVAAARAEVVLHLAAQPIVRRSFRDPRETYEVNVMGTVNVLEACRLAGGVRAIVSVTSDKCYENREWEWGYRESDPLGGHDPYSSSKGAAEIVTSAFRRSFGLPLASARAGNVIGGGDWGEDRLIPDVVRAAAAGEPVVVRHPGAVRPWQHVLAPLSGYLLLAQRLLSDPGGFADAWNFGPPEEDARPVGWVVDRLAELWPGGLPGRAASSDAAESQPHEATYLKLDSSRARTRLGWRPAWGLDDALTAVAAWHAGHARGADLHALTLAQIVAYERGEPPPAPEG